MGCIFLRLYEQDFFFSRLSCLHICIFSAINRSKILPEMAEGMSGRNHLLDCFPGVILTLILLFHLQESSAQRNANCSPSSCGNIQNISYPFRLTDDPQGCGNQNYTLVCESNTTVIYLDSHKYIVRAINYDYYTVHIADASILPNDTCSFPNHSLSLTSDSPYSTQPYGIPNRPALVTPINFLSCPNPLNTSRFVPADICLNRSAAENGSISTRHSYVQVGNLYVADLEELCTPDLVALTSMQFRNPNHVSLDEIHASLVYGFQLSWFPVLCPACRGAAICSLEGDTCVVTRCSQVNGGVFSCGVEYAARSSWLIWAVSYIIVILVFVIGVCTATRVVIGLPALLVILIYRYRTRHLSKFDDIEGFLQDQNNLAPIRYSYSDIKKMTKGFREKLGQGGFGSVYKGKLRGGHDVAVKLLTNIKSNGQDFINEVATIGRIHHINVVKLIGYCAEKSTCALVYDFMPNGSLDKYISSREKSSSLDWHRKYEIAVSVAKGIDYLHQGCDIKILHFDIKPHNILLDNDFNPKISDFGLAKFSSGKNSTVAISAIRGTIGYVAPELINRSIGKVSNKADVYSFGMMLMDMLGVKGTTAVDTNNSTQYFPDWIYARFEKGKGVVGDDEGNEEARGLKKKMIIVALWCIQMSPENRPSMRVVVEMLEGEEGVLQVPPQECAASEVGENGNQTQSTVTSSDSSALLYGYEYSTSFNID